MEETEFVTHTIWQWAEAHAVAQNNPRELIESDFSESVSQECVKRMKRLELCENEMLSLTHSIPQALQNYMNAREDSACSSCWLSSMGPKHQDCGRKIDRFFRTREELYEYALRECKPT